MQAATRKKLDEVLERIQQGETRQEILGAKFSRSQKRYFDFLARIKDELTQDEEEILKAMETEEEVTQAPRELKPEIIEIQKPIMSEPSNNLLETLKDNNKVEAFLKLLDNTEAILKLVEGNKKKEGAEEYFYIPAEYLKLNDTKTKSFRLSEEIDQGFNKICEELKGEYTKTAILNYVLGEFIKRYEGK